MSIQINKPALWHTMIPRPDEKTHKYSRGMAVIYAAPEMTGASRLAATACARMGAGLVTVLCAPEIKTVYQCTLPAHIIVRDDLKYSDERISARLYGSGGLSTDLPASYDIPTVLDADALAHLPETLSDQTFLTPHEGEFAKAFPNITGSREEKALKGAEKTGATCVLKGAHTYIAAPDGRCVKSNQASPYLATAGSGDVLAGMITGLLAQHMPAYEAACAAVWIHGECARRHGIGLVASDLSNIIPTVLNEIT